MKDLAEKSDPAASNDNIWYLLIDLKGIIDLNEYTRLRICDNNRYFKFSLIFLKSRLLEPFNGTRSCVSKSIL